MSMEENMKSEQERKEKKGWRFNRTTAVRVMRCVLFVVLLLLGVGVALFIELCNYEDYWKGSRNKEEFYKTDAFENVLDSWASQVCSCMRDIGYIEKEAKLDASEKLYSLTEYAELTDKELFDKKTVTKDSLPADTVSYSDLQAKDAVTAENITRGIDNGESIYFFYGNFRESLQQQIRRDDVKDYIHLTGKEYHELLEKYCVEDGLDSEAVKENFATAIGYFNTYEEDELDGYEGDEADSDGEKKEKHVVKSFYNDAFNGNFAAYANYGGEDGNGHFMLAMPDDVMFDYAARDVSESRDFYIPTALLDYSSREAFEKSLITTPFTTVEAVMAYLSTQTKIEQFAAEEYEHYWEYRHMNEFEYIVTYLDEKHQEQVFANCDESRMKNGYRIVYDRNKGTVTSDIPADYIKKVSFFENFKELGEIVRVEVRVDSCFGFNRLGVTYLLSLAAAHKGGLFLAGVLLLLLLLALLVGITCLLPAKVYPRDCHFLLTKTILCAGAAGAFGSGAVYLLYYLCMVGMYFTPAVRLAAVGIAFVFLLGVAYAAITEYWFSITRLIKAKQFEQYLFLHHVCGRAAGGIHRISRFVEEIWNATGYAKRAVIKRVLLLLGLLFCIYCFIGCMFNGAGPFTLFFFLVLCVVLGLEGYDIYQLVLDQKMLHKIVDGIQQLTDGDLSYKIDTETMKGDKKQLAEMINHIGDGLEKAVAQSIKDERLKAELITNVSHDIKTPLTSIINYVDLMKREHVSEEPLKGYIEVLEQKSQRLKQLTEDLVEASKASTGNIELEPVNLNMTELLTQAIGEFEDKFLEKNLTLVPKLTEEEMVIYADGRRCYRIFENLFQNIYKYAMPNTRVYLSLEPEGSRVVLCLKNISESPLTMDVSELTGRFVRGDASRTTEGSGLGLSIAQSLTTLQNGSFQVELDGDLFKVTIAFERQENN